MNNKDLTLLINQLKNTHTKTLEIEYYNNNKAICKIDKYYKVYIPKNVLGIVINELKEYKTIINNTTNSLKKSVELV